MKLTLNEIQEIIMNDKDGSASIHLYSVINSEERNNDIKAKKWDKLADKMAEFYPDDDEESDIDLTYIGEAAAIAFGYL